TDAYSARGAGFMSLSDSMSQSDGFSMVMGERLSLAENAANLADGVDSRGQIWDIAATGEQLSQSDAMSLSNVAINYTFSFSDSINNLADSVFAKMPRWKDSISVVRNNAFSPVNQAVPDTLTSMSDAVSSARVQFLRPTSDISVGLWSTTPLFNKIDEATIDDADLIVSATSPVNDTCECAL